MALQQVTGAEFEREVLKHDGWVLVDFFAVWCPPCRALAPLLERFAEQNADRVKVVKVDTDADEALSEQYGVRTIPTVVAFNGGEEVKRAVNPQSRALLEGLIGE
jgi:thioredoxin 1